DVTAYRTLVAKGAFLLCGDGVGILDGQVTGVQTCVLAISSAVTLTTGTWQHVAITWNAATSEVKFYLNGALAQTVINASVVNARSEERRVGKEFRLKGGSYFYNKMDELRGYNRGLSDAEVS